MTSLASSAALTCPNCDGAIYVKHVVHKNFCIPTFQSCISPCPSNPFPDKPATTESHHRRLLVKL
uniref:Transcription factor n=1 Tax=Rhizophora mucronata TaxID=61149 RepID=A0A2P2KIE2_RHIMU